MKKTTWFSFQVNNPSIILPVFTTSLFISLLELKAHSWDSCIIRALWLLFVLLLATFITKMHTLKFLNFNFLHFINTKREDGERKKFASSYKNDTCKRNALLENFTIFMLLWLNILWLETYWKFHEFSESKVFQFRFLWGRAKITKVFLSN